MWRGLVIFCLFSFYLSNNVFGQEIDTISTNSADTIKKENIATVSTKGKVNVTQFIVPSILIGYGFASVYDKGALNELDRSTKHELQEDHPRFAYRVDDYSQFFPAIAVYGLNLAGVKGKNDLFDATMLYVTSAAIMGLSTHVVKRTVGRQRPGSLSFNSFPSGHTASAFAAAEFLHQEFKDRSLWIGYGGYLVAGATGALRMYNNKHWFSDVVAGAGFGMLSTKLGYLVYPQLKKLIGGQKEHLSLSPVYQQGQLGYRIAYRL